MQFEAGQRVTLVRTTDPVTDLHPGDQGTVRRVTSDQRRVSVIWDNGSRLAMLLDKGDELAAVPTAVPTAVPAAGSASDPGSVPSAVDAAVADTARDTARTASGRQDLRTAVHAAATSDGSNAADRWIQEILGAPAGNAAAGTVVTAREILDGLDRGDPAFLDSLPAAGMGWIDRLTAQQHADVAAGLTPAQWRQIEPEYAEGFRAAVTATVAAACRRVLHPAGDGRDLSHLHPDRVTVGSVGVFSGEWNEAPFDAGHRLSVGYVGTLIDRWNGWAVFACSRLVAEEIVEEHERQRDACRADYIRSGLTDAEIGRPVDEEFSRLWWDGDVLVADSTIRQGDPTAFERIAPRPDGRYVVMGRSWTWEPVNPYDCARIIGDLPEPGHEREWIPLTHSPDTTVPPAPYTLGRLATNGTSRGYTAELRYDGVPVAAAVGVAAPAPAMLTAQLEETRDQFDAAAWAAFVAAARRRDEPMTEAAVLDALAQEALLEDATSQAAAAGGTLARLLDDTGTVLTVQFTPVPDTPRTFDAVRERLSAAGTHPTGVVWQLWTGRSWRHLTPTAPTAPSGGTAQAH